MQFDTRHAHRFPPAAEWFGLPLDEQEPMSLEPHPTARPARRPSAPTFQLLTRANLPELADGLTALEEAVHGRRLEHSFWQWRYFENPAGGSVTVVALRDGTVLGKSGGVLVPLFAGGVSRTACLMEGLCVLPGERSWPIYRGLLASHAEHSRQAGIDLFFGFSTRLAAGMHRRLGYPDLGRCPVWSGFLDARKVLRSRSIPASSLLAFLAQPLVCVGRRAPGKDVEIAPLEQFGGEVDEFRGAVEERNRVAVDKNAAYLQWRYVRCPGQTYRRLGAWRAGRLEGYAVSRFSRLRGDGYLLELTARHDDPTILSNLASESLRALADEGAGLVSASFRRRSPQARVLRSLGFKIWGTWLWNMRTILAGAWIEAGLLAPGTRWDYTLGDWLYY
jgi:hypothetical protein